MVLLAFSQAFPSLISFSHILQDILLNPLKSWLFACRHIPILTAYVRDQIINARDHQNAKQKQYYFLTGFKFNLIQENWPASKIMVSFGTGYQLLKSTVSVQRPANFLDVRRHEIKSPFWSHVAILKTRMTHFRCCDIKVFHFWR